MFRCYLSYQNRELIFFTPDQIALDSDGQISEEQAMAVASTNLKTLLGVTHEHLGEEELVAYQGGNGGIFNFEAKPVAVLSPARGFVDLF